jgi:hypothetical protein
MMHPFDTVAVEGETVGVSTWIGYTANEGKMLTLAILDADCAEPGTEVTFVCGEPDGGSRKPTVEPHVQTEIRARSSAQSRMSRPCAGRTGPTVGGPPGPDRPRSQLG